MMDNIISLCRIVFTLISIVYVSEMSRLPTSGKPTFYTAAVYENAVVFPEKRASSYDEAVSQMFPNLDEYKRQADIAGTLGADIIVFPEDGIYGYLFATPSDIENYLEYIPDPAQVDWTPCTEPLRYERTKIQTFLSCLAKNNSMYLVANYGDKQPCHDTDPNCPKNGHYQYNTNIVFDRNGKLIARYHKQNLFFESQFNTPASPEFIYFDTEFGRFGTFTCFDILFHDPAIPLIEKYNVTDIVFPTAWMDALPFLSAIGYHSSFAVAYNVNFLSANLHQPSKRFQGSGIYTPKGSLAFYYNRSFPDGRLLVKDVPILMNNSKRFEKKKVTLDTSDMQFIQRHDFQGRVFKDRYNFVSLRSKVGNVTVCQADLCCYLSYNRVEVTGNYAFGVFSGVHERHGPYYLQVCILLECGSDNATDCYHFTFLANGYFNNITIKGNFSTPYVTPQVLTTDNGNLELLPPNALKFNERGFNV
ncbi:pantetheinase-like [Ruditapes philippinarum]|uniref:pantetheinase-like n=1 Tax=Ruditapes philippinarum TaxID=129788 RepID=UPI00295AF839|nr:pantetheinase-like [Ruditapes philippinarum]